MLKQLAGSFVILSLVACASSQKKDSTSSSNVEKSSSTTETAASQPAEKAASTKKTEASKKESVKKEKAAVSASAEAGTCVSGTDKRTFEIKKNETGGCELHYGKNGEASKIADQINGTNHCEEVQEKIKAKLRSAGFTCS